MAAAIVAAEAVGAGVLAVLELAAMSSQRLALGITTAVFFAGYGAGLGLCARGLLQLRTWCRGPIVLTQIIQLGLAWSFAGQETLLWSVVLGVPAVVVLVAMLAPSTTAALYGSDAVDGDERPAAV